MKVFVLHDPDLSKYRPQVTHLVGQALEERDELGLVSPENLEVEISLYPGKQGLGFATQGGCWGKMAIAALARINAETGYTGPGATLEKNLDILSDLSGLTGRPLWDLISDPDAWRENAERALWEQHKERARSIHEFNRRFGRSPADIAGEATYRRNIIDITYDRVRDQLPEQLGAGIEDTIRHELEHCAHMTGPLWERWQKDLVAKSEADYEFRYAGNGTSRDLAEITRQAAISEAERTAITEARAWTFNAAPRGKLHTVTEEELAACLIEKINAGYTSRIIPSLLDSAVSDAWSEGLMNEDTSTAIHTHVYKVLGIEYRGTFDSKRLRVDGGDFVRKRRTRLQRQWHAMVNTASQATAHAFMRDPTRLNQATYAGNFDAYVKICMGE